MIGAGYFNRLPATPGSDGVSLGLKPLGSARLRIPMPARASTASAVGAPSIRPVSTAFTHSPLRSTSPPRTGRLIQTRFAEMLDTLAGGLTVQLPDPKMERCPSAVRAPFPSSSGIVVLVTKLEDRRDAPQQVQFGLFTGQMSGSKSTVSRLVTNSLVGFSSGFNHRASAKIVTLAASPSRSVRAAH